MQQPQQPPLSASDFARFSSDEEDADLTGHGPNIDDSEIVLSENGVIGQGNFGVVHRGMCRGAQVAVKIPKVEDLNEEKLEEFRAELK